MKYKMKNSVPQDNRLAQAVKIILFLASFFIFWSALALISSIYTPLSISWPFTPAIETASTLADSLYQEIIYSYFSLFTISVLIIILLAGILGFHWSRQVSGSFFPSYEDQSPFRVLLNRLFNATPHKILDLSAPEMIKKFIQSDGQINGPVKILIQDGALVLISKGVNNFRVLVSNGSTPIQISSSERLVKLLPSTKNEFFVGLFIPSPNDVIKAIQLRYSFDLHNLAKNANYSGYQFLSGRSVNYWQELMDSIIQLEFDSLIKAEGKFALEMSSTDPQELNNGVERARSSLLPHPMNFSSKPLIKSKISRNRKRGVYPLVTSVKETVDELESRKASLEKLTPLMNVFFENLARTTIQLFGFNPIKIIGYEIGKEK